MFYLHLKATAVTPVDFTKLEVQPDIIEEESGVEGSQVDDDHPDNRQSDVASSSSSDLDPKKAAQAMSRLFFPLEIRQYDV